ncbi:VRR-NUC domain-containing protein [Pseudomonas aeruginosa]|uniref:VRR-NUC domain-containing protein n=4 Tax=Pseudomonas aeruginosa TaxID=287 RepID=A0A6A9JZC5_PSEAI|nr:VRR-NUC domain-containing protein [Pseudomonas aeruginosa]MBG4398876.1 VRR-NUC domain-containing protein [Pseudomonas aeruginosa]MEB6162627.1 VRR-NUC domain-containing protein [Pseudomonas aeruginosa]MUI61324.1 VRR-NUC domain-containing protein [Pseudomonas aeruginosa]QTQ99420.1 VRR-NUC domain-containing protein [Pseudomonas aeruginosa]RUE01737.1 VRR-NUC domain-containing protein [Pseudomonas aeruginosa]
MSDQPSLAQGGMSPEGKTNPVGILEPKLDPQDKQVLCSAICHCSSTPNVSQDGRNLKQACVAQRLGELDEILRGRSPYKPEVSYDMTKSPPQPILDSQTGSSAHGWIPGWISKYWNEDPEHPPFKPGRGMIRRPDVVIVKDPIKPPTQDNIKQVVEMKFPPDPPDSKQVKAYEKIAGDERKIVEMKSTECDCSQENQQSKVPVEQLGWAATIAGAVMFIVTRGRSPRPSIPVPAY